MDNDAAVRKRRYEDDLNVSGIGVIVMGAWGSLKVIVEVFTGTDSIFTLLDSGKEDDPEFVALTAAVAVVIVLILLSFIMLLHLYVGLNAIRASRGLKHRRGYLAVTVLMLVLTLLGASSYRDMFEDPLNVDTSVASLLVDLTTVYIFAVVIRSAYMLKKLEEKQTGE